MTDHPLLLVAILACGLLTAFILFRAAQNVLHSRARAEEEEEA